MPRHTFDRPDRFIVGTVGEPGARAFYLQAKDGATIVSVALEKGEVAALAEGLSVLLAEVRRGGGPTPKPGNDVEGHLDREPLESPVEEDFRLERLSVAWDGSRVVVEAAAGGTAEDEPEPELDAAEAALAAQLEDALDAALVEQLRDASPAPDVSLQVGLSVEQAYAFVARAQSVVAAGRSSCPLCGRPDGPQGHFCPRLN